MSSTDSSPRRVFISYSWDSGEHEDWVYNLAERLTGHGIHVIFDKWDTRLGSDLAAFMETGLTGADRVLVVSSADYVRKADGLLGGAGYEKKIMTAQMMQDLTSDRVVPIIRNNEGPSLTPTFLSGAKYIDFRNDDLFENKYQELIHDLYGRTLRPRPPLGRSPFADDSATPSNLGTTQRDERAPASGPLWRPEAITPDVVWRKTVFNRDSGQFFSNTLVEVELVPTEPSRVEVRRLQGLRDELASLGRQFGFFNGTQALDAQATANETWVRVHQDRNWAENGLMVTRAGQRGFWVTLPRDDMGAVFDTSDLPQTIAAGLRLVDQIPIDTPSRYAVGAAMAPIGMLTVGSVAVLGARNTAQMAGFGKSDIYLSPEDSVASRSLTVQANDIAEEIVARLAAQFNSH